MTVRYKTYSYDIAAGAAVDIRARGNYVRCVEANADFELAIDGEIAGFFAKGIGYQTIDGEEFREVRAINNSGAPLSLKISIGFGRIQDSRASFGGSLKLAVPVTLQDVADKALVAGVVTQVVPQNTSRREVLITNLASNSAIIRVGSASVSGTRGTELTPGQTLTLDTTAAVYAYSASALSVAILEIVE